MAGAKSEDTSKKRKRGQGEGSIFYLEDKKLWCAKLSVGYDEKGNRKRKVFYGKTRTEVQKKLTSALNEINNNTYIEPSKMTLAQWIDIWLLEYKKISVKESTYMLYRKYFGKHIKPLIGSFKLKDLRNDLLQKFVNDLLTRGLSPLTIRNIHNIVHAALNQAVENELIQKNVSEKIKLPKILMAERKVLSMEEQNKLIGEARKVRHGEAFILALATGLRIGEVLALTWEDINFDDSTLKVSKTLTRVKDMDNPNDKYHNKVTTTKTPSSNRIVPLLPDVVTMLREIQYKQISKTEKLDSNYQNSNLVFRTLKGTAVSAGDMREVFGKLRTVVGLDKDMHIHNLRHTFATRGLENGIELKVMQELLGHSSIKMTADIYTHVTADKKKDSIMKLNGVIKI